MNVFLISRVDHIEPGEYAAAIVVAPNEQRAREEALHLSSGGAQGTLSFLDESTAECEYIGTGKGPVRVVLESLAVAGE